jgi:hypothetical protein
MQASSASSTCSPPFAEPGQAEVDAALAAMTPAARLASFWRAQEAATARSWALLGRSGLDDPRDRIRLLIRARYPDWPDADVDRLLAAICDREDPAEWLDRLRRRAQEITARLATRAKAPLG